MIINHIIMSILEENFSESVLMTCPPHPKWQSCPGQHVPQDTRRALSYSHGHCAVIMAQPLWPGTQDSSPGSATERIIRTGHKRSNSSISLGTRQDCTSLLPLNSVIAKWLVWTVKCERQWNVSLPSGSFKSQSWSTNLPLTCLRSVCWDGAFTGLGLQVTDWLRRTPAIPHGTSIMNEK